jgi:hypothetical protein
MGGLAWSFEPVLPWLRGGTVLSVVAGFGLTFVRGPGRSDTVAGTACKFRDTDGPTRGGRLRNTEVGVISAEGREQVTRVRISKVNG